MSKPKVLSASKTHKVIEYGGQIEHYEIVDGYLEMFVGYEHTVRRPEKLMTHAEWHASGEWPAVLCEHCRKYAL